MTRIALTHPSPLLALPWVLTKVFICSYIFDLAKPLAHLQTLYLVWLQTSSQCYDPISPTNSARSIVALPWYPFNIFLFLSLPVSSYFLTQDLRSALPVFAILRFLTVTASMKTFWTIPSNYCLHFCATCSHFSWFNGWFTLVFDCLIHQNGRFNRRGIMFDFPCMFMDTRFFLKLFAIWRDPPWHMLHGPDKHNGIDHSPRVRHHAMWSQVGLRKHHYEQNW